MVYLLFSLCLGIVVGSFLNCLIWRLHKKQTIMGRSYCPQCQRQIIWYDNIPLLSFLFLKGKCRHCQIRISWQYPIVELVTGLLFALAWYFNFGLIDPTQLLTLNFELLTTLRDWFLISVMIVVFIYDLRWYLILDIVTLPSALIIFILNVVIYNFQCNQYSSCASQWSGLVISGIIGGSFFLIQFLISRGRWIGGGDIRLGLLMGLALGWPYILLALFIAYISGSVVGLSLIGFGKKSWGSKVPFGVFLSSATIATLFLGERILSWYLNLLNF